jgi:hypothetical protein
MKDKINTLLLMKDKIKTLEDYLEDCINDRVFADQ